MIRLQQHAVNSHTCPSAYGRFLQCHMLSESDPVKTTVNTVSQERDCSMHVGSCTSSLHSSLWEAHLESCRKVYGEKKGL